MRIEMVDAFIDDGNGEVPLTYTVDSVRKQIAWSALSALFGIATGKKTSSKAKNKSFSP